MHTHLLVPDYSAAKIIVIGDIMLDRYWHGTTSRISPEAPVPVVHVNNTREQPGGAGNVALNIHSLGASTQLHGLLGDDQSGHMLRHVLEQAGIVPRIITQTDATTTTKLRIISLNQQLLRLDFEDAPTQWDAIPLFEDCQQALKQSNAHALILSDYGKGALPEPQPYIQLAKQLNIPVFVDPKGKDFRRYHGATLLTPNQREFEMVVGTCHSEQEMIDKALQAIQENDLKGLLVTRGKHGMLLVQQDQPALSLSAHSREVYDVTGAGDTVIATLASTYAVTQDLALATHLANIAASITVTKLGAASVSPAELRRKVQKLLAQDTGVKTQAEVLQSVADAHSHGERIVMTNGCFDILHQGHITYLEQAKALGDRLLIAVNDDASVERLKGAGRPINTLERRMAVLAGLSSVDWVVPFGEDTPQKFIEQVSPDVLVKGGDYKVEDIAGHKHVLANGGEVIILDFVPDCSTTLMVNQISNLGLSKTSQQKSEEIN